MKLRLLIAVGLFCAGAAFAQQAVRSSAASSRATQQARTKPLGSRASAHQSTQDRAPASEPYENVQFAWAANRSVPDVRVTPDLNKTPLKEALKRIFGPIGLDYVVDKDVPEDVPITLGVSNVRLDTVLDLITQAAGVHWYAESKDSKTVYHISKSAQNTGLSLNLPNAVTLDSGIYFNRDQVANVLTVPRASNRDFLVYELGQTEERSTFTCPHCKGQVTTIRQRQQPKCPKCGRTFQNGWQFCPFDGTKRPPAPGTWKYCPLCGKPIEIGKPEAGKSERGGLGPVNTDVIPDGAEGVPAEVPALAAPTPNIR